MGAKKMVAFLLVLWLAEGLFAAEIMVSIESNGVLRNGVSL